MELWLNVCVVGLGSGAPVSLNPCNTLAEYLKRDQIKAFPNLYQDTRWYAERAQICGSQLYLCDWWK